MKTVLMCAVCMCLTSFSWSDTGVFYGTGQNIRQTTSEEIQLVSIDVVINPKAELGNVDYSCTFVLKNLTDKAEKVKVGLPLNSYDAGGGPRHRYVERSAQERIKQYSFVVCENTRPYEVDFTPYDEEKKYDAVFNWNMNFKPHELITLSINYNIDISEGSMVPTGKEDLSSMSQDESMVYMKDKKLWMGILEQSCIKTFGYITETGSTWAGNVEQATFTVVTEPYETIFDRINYFSGINSLDKERQLMKRLEFPEDYPWWFRRVLPEGWKPIKNGIQWSYKNFKPKEPIMIGYYLTKLPRYAKDIGPLIHTCKYFCEKESWNVSDLISLKEIVLATFGKEPADKCAKAFVEDQIWYKPHKEFSMKKVTKEQQAIVKEFDRRIAESLEKPK